MIGRLRGEQTKPTESIFLSDLYQLSKKYPCPIWDGQPKMILPCPGLGMGYGKLVG